MVWLGRSKAPDRIRPSEINGCQVQQVSYMDEIDDENVLEALEKLRGRSAASPAKAFLTPTTRPPRVPKQSSVKSSMGLAKQKSTKSIATANQSVVQRTPSSKSNSSSAAATPQLMVQKVPSASPSKGSHRSFDSLSKKSSLQQAPPAAIPISPDSSVASSVVSKPTSHRGAKQQQIPTHPNKLIWAWLGKSLSEINCGGFSTDGSTEAAADQMKALGVILRSSQENGGEQQRTRQQRLSALNRALSQHLVKRCRGDGNDNDDGDDERTLGSATLQTLRSATMDTLDSATALTDPTYQEDGSLRDADSVYKDTSNEISRDDVNDSPESARKSTLKHEIARFLDATAKLLVEGGFGDNDTVTLYAYDDMSLLHDRENGDEDGTFYTLETGSYDETLTLTLDEEAPHDEMHQDMRSNNSKNLGKTSNNQIETLGQVLFASGDSQEGIFSRNVALVAVCNEEGQEVDQDGVPEKLLVVGYESPDDCSFLSDSSPIYMQAVNKKGKLIQ